ncbi:MAG: ferredoxin--NADP reductase [Vicingaceae bacterium]
MSTHFHRLKVEQIIKETPQTVSIVFDIPEDLQAEYSFEAGQYLTLKTTIGGEEIRRSYSICSFGDEKLKVSSKMIDGGKMSTYLFNELSVGNEMDVMPPMGNFTLDDLSKPLVLFAAGSGITPIMSILKKSLQEGKESVYLYYGNRSTEEIIFKNELEELKARYSGRLLVQHFLSSDGERLDADRTASIVNGLQDAKDQTQFFICGPSGMIEAVKSGLTNAEISSDQINIEYFASPKQEKTVVEEVLSSNIDEVTVIIDDEEHNIKLDAGETILEAAERIGVDPPFSCQSGVCTTCKAKLLRGEVEMENNFGLGEDEIADGYVLTCIGKPKTAGVKISWDDV